MTTENAVSSSVPYRPTALCYCTDRKSERPSGGEYVNRKIREILNKQFVVKEFYVREVTERYLKGRLGQFTYFLLFPFFLVRSFIALSKYEVVFAEWDYAFPLFADFVYFQPYAGADSQKGLFYSPFIRAHPSFRNCIRKLQLSFARLFYNVSLNRTTILSNSDYVRKLTEQKLGLHSLVVYPPVKKSETGLQRERENLVLIVSRVSIEKNLSMIGRIGPLLPELTFALIGVTNSKRGRRVLEQVEQSFEERGLKNNFQYLGYVSEEEKHSLMRRAKVLFHPAINEAFGLGIAEGMLAGCLPVVHDSGGPREYVTEDWRFISDENAIHLIRRAIKLWDFELSLQMRKKASRFDEGNFGAQIAKLTEIIRAMKH